MTGEETLMSNVTVKKIKHWAKIGLVPYLIQINQYKQNLYKHKVQAMKTQRGINLLKPTGHVMHQQFNIQQLYVLPTMYLCVLYLSENKQRPVPLIS